jgi:L-rhamnose isomerase
VGLTPQKLAAALSSAGLSAGAVCLRFPAEEYSLGAFSNPDAAVRAKAVQLSVEGCRWAAQLGAREVILWAQFDGYDYSFQVDYLAAWERTVQSLRQLADACPPGIRISLEPKPTDELTRLAIVPSTAAALLLAKEVDRPNFGLTLDMGHMLLAGENPAQSVALVGAAGKLFGLQLNDAHVRLGAEDGLAFASVSSSYALELVRWLQRLKPDLHIFFDTFPKKEDPVREAEHNIRTFKRLWAKAARLAAAGLDGFAATHDAMGALELLAAHEQAAEDAAAAAAGGVTNATAAA